MKYLVPVLLLLSFSFSLISCSDDSSGPGMDDLGEATLTVSGDVNTNHTGQADFWSLETGAINIWEITMNDFSPQTFSMTVMLTSTGSVERPGPGTYDIDAVDGFTAIYEFIENEDFANTREFTNSFCDDSDAGTLTITSSSDSEVRGSFSATLSEWDIDDMGNCINFGTVNVTGEFRATERIGLFE